MRDTNMFLSKNLVVFLLMCLAGVCTAEAQGRMTIQATARGTSTQRSKVFGITIIIEQFSTPEDRKTLIDAFTRSGQDALVNALQDMTAKGRVRFSSGGVGNDIKYIIPLPSEKGRRFRLVTDRSMAMGELYHGTRSRDYSVSAIELVLTPDGKGSGTLLPACKLMVNKKTQQIEIETYKNPFNLTHFIVHDD